MKRFILTISINVFACMCFSQSGFEREKEQFINVYQKTWDWMANTQNYSFQLSYFSYKDHSSKEPFEVAKGYYKKSGNNFICDVMGVKTIQNNRMKITVDSAEKLMVITKPQALNAIGLDIEQVKDLLDNAAKIKVTDHNSGKAYKIEFHKNELYERVEFKFNREQALIQLTYFYAEQVDRDYNDNGEMIDNKLKPRLEICFTDYKQTKGSAEIFSEDNYLAVIDNKIKALDKYKSYELKDYRFQKQ